MISSLTGTRGPQFVFCSVVGTPLPQGDGPGVRAVQCRNLRRDYITAELLSTEVDKLPAGTYYSGVV